MRRRQFLASTVLLGTTVLAGCPTSRKASPDTPTADESVTEWSFERTDYDREEGVEQPPTVTCSATDNRVRVEGQTETGRGCDVLAPKTIARDGQTFEFVVGIYEGGVCGEALEFSGYEAEFVFSGAMPSRVVAVESITEAWGESRRTEKRCGE